MIWLVLLIILFFAVCVYFSIIIAAAVVKKLNNLEAQVSELFENDEWCEKEIKETNKTTDELYSMHMTDSSKAWLKMDALNNEINRTKMRVGKLEQKENTDVGDN